MQSKEFELDSQKTNLAEIIFTGRYPECGFVINKKSEMTVYILDGNVRYIAENKTVMLQKSDAILVPTNTPYAWLPENSVTLLILSTPPWSKDQQEIII